MQQPLIKLSTVASSYCMVYPYHMKTNHLTEGIYQHSVNVRINNLHVVCHHIENLSYS